jgi:hypothetical protein
MVMTEYKPLEKKNWLNFLNIRRAIVELQPGETEEEAWNRHLTRHPEDRWANIRIFNRQPLRAPNT